uniref:WAP domain-containing protein n=1 Tax=Chrysemys picta bellii TaxID=8478 RepID=A0A8C3IXY9_CHRPI
PAACALGPCPRQPAPRCGQGLTLVAPCVAVKPGACPAVLRGSLGPCVEGCRSDSDCSKAEKCCSTGCGHVCKPPSEGEGCPAVAQGQAGACDKKCRRDDDCPGSQKCCGNGCGSECTSVTPEGESCLLLGRGGGSQGFPSTHAPPSAPSSQGGQAGLSLSTLLGWPAGW